MKRHLPVLTALLVAAAIFAAAKAAPAQSDLSRTSIPLGATRIELTHDQLVANDFDIRAFVPTGSLSPNCLVTLAESNFAVPGISTFCAPRIVDGQNGVLVSLFFPTPPPADVCLAITLYQEHARGYGPPALYTGQ